jgi:hypothetical protein
VKRWTALVLFAIIVPIIGTYMRSDEYKRLAHRGRWYE